MLRYRLGTVLPAVKGYFRGHIRVYIYIYIHIYIYIRGHIRSYYIRVAIGALNKYICVYIVDLLRRLQSGGNPPDIEVFLDKGTRVKTPNYDSPYYWDHKKGTKPPYRR